MMQRIFQKIKRQINRGRRAGFSLIELMVTAIILAIVIGGGYTILASGESAWFTTDANIQLSESLRLTIEKLTTELKESGHDSLGNLQVTVNDGGGVNGSDLLRFSFPIVCETTSSVIDNNGDVAVWGSSIRWGCTDSSCMDANDDCTSRDYRYVEYRLNNNNQLLRRVLNNVGGFVRDDVFANNITDLQTTISADEKIVTVVITAQSTTALNRVMTATRTSEVYLRNST